MKSFVYLLLVLALVLTACGAPATPAAAPTGAPTSAPTAAPPTTAPVATAVPPTATSVPPTPTAVPPTATPTLAPSPTVVAASPTPAQKEVMVVIRNFEFAPKFITVSVGTKVTWMVEQGTHTTTSDDFRSQGPNAWHSGNLTVGQKFSFTFNNAGQFRYRLHRPAHVNMIQFFGFR